MAPKPTTDAGQFVLWPKRLDGIFDCALRSRLISFFSVILNEMISTLPGGANRRRLTGDSTKLRRKINIT